MQFPFEALDALRAARGWQPPPVFYAIVGAAALMPAVAIAALTRVRWPVALIVVPFATMAVVFLWSMATVRGGRRAVLERVAPDRAWRQDYAEEVALLREQVGDFRLIEPADWPGEVLLESGIFGLFDGNGRVFDVMRVIADQGDPALDLDHPAPGWEPATPTLEIRCFRSASSFSEDELLREFFAHTLDDEQVDDSERLVAEWRGRWEDGTVRVDGRQVPARSLVSDDLSVTWFRLDDQHTLVIAEGVEASSVELREVHDPAPLIDGSAVRRDRLAASWKR